MMVCLLFFFFLFARNSQLATPSPQKGVPEEGEEGGGKGKVFKRFNQSSASPSLPALTSSRHSSLHPANFARSRRLPSVFMIHSRSKFSSSGTKNEESSESTVSKLAEGDIILPR